MKAENQSRLQRGESLAYTEPPFAEKAGQLENLHNLLHSVWQDGHAQ